MTNLRVSTIDETDVVTYKSENAPLEGLLWLAFVILPNGKYWDVRFSGATEEEAKQKAIALWNSEQSKYVQQYGRVDRIKNYSNTDTVTMSEPLATKNPIADPWASEAEKQHH